MAKRKGPEVSTVRAAKHGGLLTLFFSILCFIWIFPLLVVVLNSFKLKAYIFRYPFGISSKSIAEGWDNFVAGAQKIFCGWLNYGNAIEKTNFWNSFGNSLFITVGAVCVIILCCSMCAWYIVRVNTIGTKIMYLLCLFSMIVPFQMVMFTLSKFANMLHLSNPIGIIVVYLGFGAGLSVFMFTGFVKSISLEIEEAAMIDGCSPMKTFWVIMLPLAQPGVITVTIFNFLAVWNEYFIHHFL